MEQAKAPSGPPVYSRDRPSLTLFSLLRILSPGSHSQARGHGGGTEGERTVSGGCDPQVYLFDHRSALVFLTNEKTSPQIPFWPLLPSYFSLVVSYRKQPKTGFRRLADAATCYEAERSLGCGGMRLLDRYLLRELLVPLGYCLCGFLIFWITSDLFVTLGDFQGKGLLVRDIVEYYLVILPEFLTLVLPIALLLALLYALTNHARHQEITAIRAAGVSLRSEE